jgi:hypothetical protein
VWSMRLWKYYCNLRQMVHSWRISLEIYWMLARYRLFRWLEKTTLCRTVSCKWSICCVFLLSVPFLYCVHKTFTYSVQAWSTRANACQPKIDHLIKMDHELERVRQNIGSAWIHQVELISAAPMGLSDTQLQPKDTEMLTGLASVALNSVGRNWTAQNWIQLSNRLVPLSDAFVFVFWSDESVSSVKPVCPESTYRDLRPIDLWLTPRWSVMANATGRPDWALTEIELSAQVCLVAAELIATHRTLIRACLLMSLWGSILWILFAICPHWTRYPDDPMDASWTEVLRNKRIRDDWHTKLRTHLLSVVTGGYHPLSKIINEYLLTAVRRHPKNHPSLMAMIRSVFSEWPIPVLFSAFTPPIWPIFTLLLVLAMSVFCLYVFFAALLESGYL